MNIILGQGTSIKEIHNVKKQNLEFSQQFVAQKTEDTKKEDKSKVQEFDTKNRIEIQKDPEKKKDSKGKRRRNNPAHDEEERSSGENQIDIRI